jgi:RimJ/RimL family protein N-acetyltransferase
MFELQPHLANAHVTLRPLREGDLDPLYALASDPLVWEQHPSRTRYERPVFETYFRGAMESRGALLIASAATGEPMGSSRYYDLDEPKRVVAIGYTFLGRAFWGSRTPTDGVNYNRAVKELMLDHALRFVDRVVFHVGAENHRSRAAMTKLGAVLVGELDVAYYGEKSNPNVVFAIDKAAWAERAR